MNTSFLCQRTPFPRDLETRHLAQNDGSKRIWSGIIWLWVKIWTPKPLQVDLPSSPFCSCSEGQLESAGLDSQPYGSTLDALNLMLPTDSLCTTEARSKPAHLPAVPVPNDER